MRIWFFSDWHLEHHQVPERMVTEHGFPDADVCVVPGDMHRGDLEVAFLGEAISARMPVVMTAGNHSFYGQSMPDMRRTMAEEALRFPNLHLLDPGSVVISGVRFVGGTLWTDYALLGEQMRPLAMREAAASLNDHRTILHGSAKDPDARIWSPSHALAEHEAELAFIESILATPFDGPTVVVSHHGPHPNSVHERFRGQAYARLNAAFVSDLSRVIDKHAPALWIHGHIHDSVDYVVGETRICANPRGYQLPRGAENALYDPVKVVEV